MNKQLSLSWWIHPSSECEYGIDELDLILDLEVWEADDENFEYYVKYCHHFHETEILYFDCVLFYLEEL